MRISGLGSGLVTMGLPSLPYPDGPTDPPFFVTANAFTFQVKAISQPLAQHEAFVLEPIDPKDTGHHQFLRMKQGDYTI